MANAIQILSQSGVRPTPQRIAVIDFVLSTDAHPTADDVLANVRATCPTISRATVYNTLNLLVSKGLLRTQLLREGTVVFDPKIEAHHHFIDDETGRIYDVPWDAISVSGEDSVTGFNVRDYQVVMRGSVAERRPKKDKKRKPQRTGG
jgi:Fe2+ or Zn2+ uptake regulation protein